MPSSLVSKVAVPPTSVTPCARDLSSDTRLHATSVSKPRTQYGYHQMVISYTEAAVYNSCSNQVYNLGFQPPVTLPQCNAQQCSKSCHFDEWVGVFKYCSPECRDRDLLHKEQYRLQKDLETFEEEVKQSAPNEGKQKYARGNKKAGSPSGSSQTVPPGKWVSFNYHFYHTSVYIQLHLEQSSRRVNRKRLALSLQIKNSDVVLPLG